MIFKKCNVKKGSDRGRKALKGSSVSAAAPKSTGYQGAETAIFCRKRSGCTICCRDSWFINLIPQNIRDWRVGVVESGSPCHFGWEWSVCELGCRRNGGSEGETTSFSLSCSHSGAHSLSLSCHNNLHSEPETLQPWPLCNIKSRKQLIQEGLT